MASRIITFILLRWSSKIENRAQQNGQYCYKVQVPIRSDVFIELKQKVQWTLCAEDKSIGKINKLGVVNVEMDSKLLAIVYLHLSLIRL